MLAAWFVSLASAQPRVDRIEPSRCAHAAASTTPEILSLIFVMASFVIYLSTALTNGVATT